jgi:hypothetical protein
MKASDKLAAMAKKVDSILPKLINQGKMNFLLEGKDSIPDIIKRRTRLGRGVNDGGGLDKLKPLSDKYKNRRKNIALSGETKPNKSNLTLTGEMLNSIIGSIRGTIASFTFKGDENNKKAGWAEEGGRPFFKLSESEKNGISRKIASVIRKALRKLSA